MIRACTKFSNKFLRRSAVVAARTMGSASFSALEVVSPSIGLNEEQVAFYNLAKSFADSDMKPYAAKWDEDSHFPVDVLKKLAELGFGGMFISEEYEGSGLSRVDTSVIVEALATGCVGTTAMLTIHNMCAGMIQKYGSSDLKVSLHI